MAELWVTNFASAARADLQDVQAAFRLWSEAGEMAALMDAVGSPMMILNRQRQLVYVNEMLLIWSGAADVTDLLGIRPGEVMDCVHASEMPGGCGASAACAFCGALEAVLVARQGRPGVQDSRILRKDGSALDLRVSARPFTLQGFAFIVVTLTDISAEKRRRALEHVFFHDLLNTSTVLFSAVELLPGTENDTDLNALTRLLLSTTHRLVDEVEGQRDLLAAESGDLLPYATMQDSLTLLQEATRLYAVLRPGTGKLLTVATDAVSVPFAVDERLFGRVLGNLIVNALEASSPGATITVGCDLDGDRLTFWIHNPGKMPKSVRSQVFKRSFSTKEPGRGLGTYSVKLISERYLGGQVRFVSTEATGTTFYVSLPMGPEGLSPNGLGLFR